MGAEKQFNPGELWADDKGVHINAHGGGILQHNGLFYWFGEHKIEGHAGNAAQVGVHVYSSADLYQWKDLGIAFQVSEDPKSEITKGCIIERPKVIYNERTNKFVMWFHLELKGKGYGGARCGVAVSNTPEGPYCYRQSFRPNAGSWPINAPASLKKPLTHEEVKEISSIGLTGGPHPHYPRDMVFRRDFFGGQMSRDMTLFLDEDGKAYHIYSSEENGTLHISQLSDDYLMPAGRYVRLLPGDFNEAPTVFKKAGKYYLISSGCSGWAPNAARLAIADSIFGPWKAVGNPIRGTNDDKEKTFKSQSTYVMSAPEHPGEFIFMADRWCPENAIDGRYIWLPIRWENGLPRIGWLDHWDLSIFNTPNKSGNGIH